MQTEIVPIRVDEKEILRNLLEKYFCEFSQYDGNEINELGLYGYNYLDPYWTEAGRWAYFIRVDGKLAGFAMVNSVCEVEAPADFSMAEFFVLPVYRGRGVGSAAVSALFRRHTGRWQLKYHPKNLPSARFWHHVIHAYAAPAPRLLQAVANTLYDDGTAADVYLFETNG